MRKLILIFTVGTSFSLANVSNKEIANMFMLGFYGTNAKQGTAIRNDICKKGLGGVILFDKSPTKEKKVKNIISFNQVKKLNQELKSCNTRPLIAVDQEGGLVQRIRFSGNYPEAITVAAKGAAYANKLYSSMAKELHNLGFNVNFAPVVDLALNPKNRVIVKYGRSFGKNPQTVIKYATIFINQMHKNGIAATLKHFPGHGSSLGDTHKGFVDVTKLWKQEELLPYQYLKNKADLVMVAHIFNANQDANLPASLSKRTIDILRKDIGYNGVVISDDLQMGAISKYYSLKERVKKSINAGVDIMLFGNQVAPKKVITIDRLISIVKELVKSGEIQESSIKMANRRINRLKEKLYKGVSKNVFIGIDKSNQADAY